LLQFIYFAHPRLSSHSETVTAALPQEGKAASLEFLTMEKA
jgi:hypothetical protein